MSDTCKFEDFGNAFGYYEIDNHRKYSICVNPHDNRVYPKSALIDWRPPS